MTSGRPNHDLWRKCVSAFALETAWIKVSSNRGAAGGERPARQAIIKGYEQAVAKRVNVTGRSAKLAWRPMMQRHAYDLAKAFRSGDIDAFQPYLMEA